MAIKGEVVRYWNVFKRIIVISLTLLAVIGAHAQYDPVFSHYWLMETSYNPAAAGKGNKLNAVGAYSMGFTGYEGSPKTFYVSADLPLYLLRQYHGVGASMLNDQIGAFTHQRLSAQYAFRKSLFGGSGFGQVCSSASSWRSLTVRRLIWKIAAILLSPSRSSAATPLTWASASTTSTASGTSA